MKGDIFQFDLFTFALIAHFPKEREEEGVRKKELKGWGDRVTHSQQRRGTDPAGNHRQHTGWVGGQVGDERILHPASPGRSEWVGGKKRRGTMDPNIQRDFVKNPHCNAITSVVVVPGENNHNKKRVWISSLDKSFSLWGVT
uniref:Uncharacterized protein n=1 Tax=Paramoeba aestuarina TaxID=180227 RepID=A0A7S4NPD6_9EUKA